MRFWVYVLCCADGSYYVGQTHDLRKRVAEHTRGAGGGYTSARRPVTLVHSQEFASREDAIAREGQIKGWSRKKKEVLMRRDRTKVEPLAKGRAERPG